MKNATIAKESVQNIIEGLEKKIKNLKMDIAHKAEKLQKKTDNKSWKGKQLTKKRDDLNKDRDKLTTLEADLKMYKDSLESGTSEEVLEKNKTTYGKFIIENTKPAEGDIEVDAVEVHDEPKPEEVKPEAPKDEPVDVDKSVVKSNPNTDAKKILKASIRAIDESYAKIKKIDSFGNKKLGKIITDYFVYFYDVANYAMVIDDKYTKVLNEFNLREIPRLDPDKFDRQMEFDIIIDGVVDAVYTEFVTRMKKYIATSNALDREFMMQNLLFCEDLTDKLAVGKKFQAFIEDAAIPQVSKTVSNPKFHFELMNGAWINPVTGVAVDTETIKSKGGSAEDIRITEEYAEWCKAHNDHKAIRAHRNKVA